MVLLDRPEVGFDGVEETLARLAHQHPVIRRQATGQRPGLPPAPLKEWLAGRPESAPLELPGERGRLSVTCFREGDSTVLLLEEHRSGPDATRLRELGLTRREAEVLELVAIGRTNAQIADVLVVSPATVRKHLEKIYAKLGVHSRTEAAARAHGAPAADPG